MMFEQWIEVAGAATSLVNPGAAGLSATVASPDR